MNAPLTKAQLRAARQAATAAGRDWRLVTDANPTGEPLPKPKPKRARRSDRPTREQRILDCGWQAYAREEGHYDDGGDR